MNKIIIKFAYYYSYSIWYVCSSGFIIKHVSNYMMQHIQLSAACMTQTLSFSKTRMEHLVLSDVGLKNCHCNVILEYQHTHIFLKDNSRYSLEWQNPIWNKRIVSFTNVDFFLSDKNDAKFDDTIFFALINIYTWFLYSNKFLWGRTENCCYGPTIEQKVDSEIKDIHYLFAVIGKKISR